MAMMQAGAAYVPVKPLINKSAWATIGKVAAVAGFTSVTAAAAGFIKVGGQYVGALNKIQALTGANRAQMAAAARTLEANASTYAKMGQTVGDAAGGVVELTKAGLSLDKSLKAVNATMVLAKAGELSVADASSLVANTLNTFHMKASRAGDIANYLANAANISSADVSDLAESFKYVAPVAAATGVSLKQTNAILAELSNSGIAASNAGTGFRKFLLSLQAPSGAAKKDLKALGVEVFDASGKMKPLGTVIDLLGGKLNKLSDEKRQRIMKDVFGLQGLSSAQVILSNGAKGLGKYTKGVEKAGAAQRLAESASKGFTGTLSALRAEIISDAQAAYRKFSPSLDTAAKKVLVFAQQMKSGKGAGGQFVDTLKTLANVGKTAVTILSKIPGPVKSVGVQMLIASVALVKINAALDAGKARFAAWTTSMVGSERQLTRTQKAGYILGAGLRNLAGAGGMLALVHGASESNKGLGTLETTLGGAATGFAVGGPIGAAVGGLGGLFLGLARQVRGSDDAVKTSLGTWKAYKDTLDDVTGAVTEATRKFALQRLQQGDTLKVTRAAGLQDRQVVNAIIHGGKARDQVVAALKREKGALEDNVRAKQAELDANIKIATDNSIPLATQTAAANRVKANRQELDSLKKLTKSKEAAITATLGELGAVDKAVESKRQDIATTKDYGHTLDALPNKKETTVRALGIIPTVRGIADVAAGLHATPKEIKTLIKAAGVKTTVADVQKVIDRTNAFGKLNPHAKLYADTESAMANVNALIAGIARIHDKTVHITTSTNANVAEGVTLGRRPKKRARGGPVMAGQPYIVGDRGPRSAWELFVPDESGQILPHVRTPAYRNVSTSQLVQAATATASVAAPSLSGVRVHMNVNGRQIEGVLEEIADSRVDSAFAMAGETERAFG